MRPAPTAAQANRQPSRERKRELNRERLLDAGFAVLAEHGLAGTAASEVTQRAGLAVGTFYNHFPDKNALLAEVAAEAIASHAALLDWVTQSGTDAVERVALAVRASVTRAARLPAWAGFVGHFGLDLPDLRDVLAGGPGRLAELGGGAAPQLAAAAGIVVALSLLAVQSGGDGEAEGRSAALAVLAVLGVTGEAAERAAAHPLPG
jgi:AcrR family transcriptional regulator